MSRHVAADRGAVGAGAVGEIGDLAVRDHRDAVRQFENLVEVLPRLAPPPRRAFTAELAATRFRGRGRK